MTTIAYKDGVIAYDSRTTAGNTITNDNSEKHYERGDVHFFMCGSICDYESFFVAFNGGQVDSPPNVSCMAVVGDQIYVCGYEAQHGIWKSPIDMDTSYSIGSGSEFAWGAMDCGASAAQAIEVAIRRDTGTGGKVRTFRLPGFEPDRAVLDYPVED